MGFKNILKKAGVIAGKGALAQAGIDIGGLERTLAVSRVSDEVLEQFETAVVRAIIRAAELIEEAENESGS